MHSVHNNFKCNASKPKEDQGLPLPTNATEPSLNFATPPSRGGIAYNPCRTARQTPRSVNFAPPYMADQPVIGPVPSFSELQRRSISILSDHQSQAAYQAYFAITAEAEKEKQEQIKCDEELAKRLALQEVPPVPMTPPLGATQGVMPSFLPPQHLMNPQFGMNTGISIENIPQIPVNPLPMPLMPGFLPPENLMNPQFGANRDISVPNSDVLNGFLPPQEFMNTSFAQNVRVDLQEIEARAKEEQEANDFALAFKLQSEEIE